MQSLSLTTNRLCMYYKVCLKLNQTVKAVLTVVNCRATVTKFVYFCTNIIYICTDYLLFLE